MVPHRTEAVPDHGLNLDVAQKLHPGLAGLCYAPEIQGYLLQQLISIILTNTKSYDGLRSKNLTTGISQ